jgi:hypothetical protein
VEIRWPTDNEWEIPSLDASLQVERCTLPLLAWGSAGRRHKAAGAWHFFCDDYRFSTVWKNPYQVVDTAPNWVCEVNASLADDDVAAVALWTIYRKRWISAFWQSHGVPIAVDLNVPPRFQPLNLLGVPSGWKAFATRGKANELAVLESEYRLAEKHAGGVPLFVVLGGGEAVAAVCRRWPGAVWVPGGQW